MPYVKRFAKRKFVRKTKTYRKRRTYAPKRGAFMSKLKPELKKLDLPISVSTLDIATPYIALLPAVGLDTSDAGRIGNQINVKSIYGRVKYTPLAPYNSIRVMMVVDRQQVGDTVPAIGDLLDGDVGGYMIAPLNNRTVGRFQVLMDRIYQPDRGASNSPLYFKFYKKCNIPVRYNGSIHTDIQKNGVYLFIMSDDPEAASDDVLLGNVRVSFYDA